MAAQQPTPQSARIPPDLPSDPSISGALGTYLRNFSLWARDGFAEQMRNNQALRGVMLMGYDTPAGTNPPVWMLECNATGQLGLGPMKLGSREEPGAFVPVGPIGDGDGNFGLGIPPPAGQCPPDASVSGGAIGGWLFGWGITVNNWANNLYYDGSAWHYWHDGAGMNAQLGGGFFIQNFPAGAADQIADAPSTIFSIDTAGNTTVTSALRINGGITYCYAPPNANCHYTLVDWNGTIRSYFYWEHTADQIIVTHQSSGQNITIDSGGFHTGNCTLAGNVNVWGSGLGFPGIAYGTNNHFGFGWNNVVAGAATITVDNGGVAYGIANASDERMKESIGPSTFDCLSTVLELPLKQFRWKDIADPWQLKAARAAKEAPIVPVGVIAQEIHKIFPHGVQQGEDHDDHLGAVWGLNQNAMISLLIGAVQQLTTRVADLEAQR